MNIIFMGTPDFAVPTLNKLIKSKHNVIGVFSQPDKQKGRGHKMTFPPTKQIAVENGINVYQPTTFKNEETIKLLKELNPDLIVVVAYGKILPKAVLDMPKHGCINVHASLLPQYRGAAPIQWSVLNGDKITGVTTMYMAQGIDTGDMILKSQVTISDNETASELHDRLSVLGAELLIETISKIEDGSLVRIIQDDAQSCYAPMLSKDMSKIDFNKKAELVHNQIRGLSQWPCAETLLHSKRLKVYKSEIANIDFECKTGEIVDPKNFIVGCEGNTAVRFCEVQYENGKRMGGADFLRGHKVQKGEIIE